MPDLQTPTISLFFEGLMVFCFAADDRHCQTAFLSPDPSHSLRLTLEEIDASSSVSRERREILLEEFQIERVDFDVIGKPPTEKKVSRHEQGRREDDAEHFGWLADLEGGDFHNGDLKIRLDHKLNRQMFIHHGLFYTAVKWFVVKAPPQGAPVNLEVTRVLGCNVVLNGEEKAILSFGSRGPGLIELPNKPNTYYRIRVRNNCETSTHSEGDFQRYYEDAVCVPQGDRFNLVSWPGVQNESSIPRKLGKLLPANELLMDDSRPCDKVRLSRHTTLEGQIACNET